MTTQTTPTDTLSQLVSDAQANCQKNLRKYARGMGGEGTATLKLEDGREVVCTYSQSTGIYGRLTLRSSFTIDGKRASKEQVSVALGGRTREDVANLNPILRSAFEAQAPQLAKEYSDYVQRSYERCLAHFEGKIPSWVDYKSPWRHEISALFPKVCKVVDTKDKPYNSLHILVLQPARLKEVSETYGDEVAVQWFYKTSEKLGKLQDAELVNDRGGDVIVKGVRNGKKVVMRQQRIMKRSIHGVYFHQFPARIYVDDKFVTEAAYKKLMGDK